MREKVVESGRNLGLEVDVRYMEESTATAQEAATALGCAQGQIAKSLVFVADGDPVVCVASGAHRVDVDLLADTLDVAEVRQASPDEVRAATGYCVGGVPPFGHDLPVVLDEDLLPRARSGPPAATATASSTSIRTAWRNARTPASHAWPEP